MKIISSRQDCYFISAHVLILIPPSVKYLVSVNPCIKLNKQQLWFLIQELSKNVLHYLFICISKWNIRVCVNDVKSFIMYHRKWQDGVKDDSCNCAEFILIKLHISHLAWSHSVITFCISAIKWWKEKKMTSLKLNLSDGISAGRSNIQFIYVLV